MTELGVVQSFTVTFIVRRFNPEIDQEPYWQDFDVDMYSTDRVLDGLHPLHWRAPFADRRPALRHGHPRPAAGLPCPGSESGWSDRPGGRGAG